MIKALHNTILRGIVLSSAMALAVTAYAADDDKTTTKTTTTSASSTDKHASAFIKDASKDNEMEIALATMAKTKSQNSEVKSFAEHMLKDHTAAKQQMTTLAQAHGVALPQADKTDKKLDKFENMSASEFDKEFATMALKMHQKDIAKYEKASQQVQATDVKSFITSNLPKLREHQQHAITVAQAVGVEQSTITALTKKSTSDDAVGGSRESGLEESTDSTFEGSDEAGLKNQKGHGAHQLSEKDLDTK